MRHRHKAAHLTHKTSTHATAGRRVHGNDNHAGNTEQESTHSYCAYIRENPFTSMGMAVAGGVLLSQILTGR
ncbi:hypothetical protein [Crenothrix sp.]|uniref:hypothetical protein n=1 Tax=Crenothrix sp. TaxID=3100433 RepID=UPI00374DAA15